MAVGTVVIMPAVRFFLLSLLLLVPVNAQADDNWIIKFFPSVASLYGSTVTIGGFADANDGYDLRYDVPLFAPRPDIDVYFDHPEWGRSDSRYWYDIQSLGYRKSWELTSSSTLIGQTIQLAWDLSRLPDHYRVILTDSTTGEQINLRAAPAYRYVNSARTPRRLMITVTDTSSGGNAPPISSSSRPSTAVTARTDVVLTPTTAAALITVVAIGSAEDDYDEDGISADQDRCPGEDARGFDVDSDGCIDDSDGDGILDNRDWCVDEDASGYDSDSDGCIDDSDGDGVLDSVDQCINQYGGEYDVDNDGCPDDSDNDGISDELDACPQQDASGFDADGDGCIDDTDMDGIADNLDRCVGENAAGYDRDEDGCIDDSDRDGIRDDVDTCPNDNNRDRDADRDGCVDTLDGLHIFVEIMISTADMPEKRGAALLAVVNAALKQAEQEKFCATLDRIDAFVLQLKKEGKVVKVVGKKLEMVSEQAPERMAAKSAQRLRAYATNVAAILRQELPSGAACQ